MPTYGIEKINKKWCFFKIENNKEYWLNQKKEWSNKFDRAGVSDMKKAENFLIKLIGDDKCITK